MYYYIHSDQKSVLIKYFRSLKYEKLFKNVQIKNNYSNLVFKN